MKTKQKNLALEILPTAVFCVASMATFIAIPQLAKMTNKPPIVKEVRDVTGDNIPDITIEQGFPKRTYMFIGQEDGSYIGTKRYQDMYGKTRYFKADNGDTYFHDGEMYRKSPALK